MDLAILPRRSVKSYLTPAEGLREITSQEEERN